MRREHGFTLIEVLVSISLAAIVLVWLGSVIGNAARAWSARFEAMIERDNRDRAYAQFVMDLRYIRTAVKVPQFSSEEMVFVTSTRAGLQEVRYFRESSGVLVRSTRSLGADDWKSSVFIEQPVGDGFVYGFRENEPLPHWASLGADGFHAIVPAQILNMAVNTP